MQKDIIIYRIVILLGIALLIAGYLSNRTDVLYVAAISYLVSKGIKHWNGDKKKNSE